MHNEKISIISVSRCKYKYIDGTSKHTHNFCHLIYFIGGSGTITYENTEHGISIGDFYLIHPDVPHMFVSEKKDPLVSIEVKFMVNNDDFSKELLKLPIEFHCEVSSIKTTLEGILEEAVNKKPYYDEIITSNLIGLLYYIIRINLYNKSENTEKEEREEKYDKNIAAASYIESLPVSGDRFSKIASQVLKYLKENYSKKITIHDLVKIFAINQTDLFKGFKREYGVTLTKYLNNYRLKIAKELLVCTEMSITEISERTGFNSVHYMSRFFTENEKITPSQYRQKNSESIRTTVEDFKISNHKIVNK